MNYKDSGVDVDKEQIIMKSFLKQIEKTHMNSYVGFPLLSNNFFANVIQLTDDMGIVVSTDGVGTKLLVAQLAMKYDTVGIDCVAMNINDIICLGAQPLSFLDYIAVEKMDTTLMMELSKGLVKGAHQAGVTISGGETAQVPEMVNEGRYGGIGFDLVGTGIGWININNIVRGQSISAGDVIIGIESNGLHSNGYSLARNVLFGVGGYPIDHYLNDLHMTIGEELLKPTYIYSPIVGAFGLLNKAKALINITGDGLLNLLRVEKTNINFVIDKLPEPQPIFGMIQKIGRISDEEMFRTFNMGIGFCVVVKPEDVDEVKRIINIKDFKPHVIGHVEVCEGKKVTIVNKNLIGYGRKFYKGELK